jgi:hypothetical protein
MIRNSLCPPSFILSGLRYVLAYSYSQTDSTSMYGQSGKSHDFKYWEFGIRSMDESFDWAERSACFSLLSTRPCCVVCLCSAIRRISALECVMRGIIRCEIFSFKRIIGNSLNESDRSGYFLF